MFDAQTTADVITLLYPNSNLIIRIHHHSETKELWFVASDVCLTHCVGMFPNNHYQHTC